MNSLNENKNYKLITSNDGKIYTIDDNEWMNDIQQFTININNQIASFAYYSKITQIHTGEFIYLDNECNLNICDNNFFSTKNLGKFNFNDTEINVNAIEQLSNYKFLVSANNGIYILDSLNILPLKRILRSSFFL